MRARVHTSRPTSASGTALNKLQLWHSAGSSYRGTSVAVRLSNERPVAPAGAPVELPPRCFEGSFLPQRFGRRRHTHASGLTPATLARVQRCPSFWKSTARQHAADNRHAILRCPAFSYISTRPIDPSLPSDYSSYTPLQLCCLLRWTSCTHTHHTAHRKGAASTSSQDEIPST